MKLRQLTVLAVVAATAAPAQQSFDLDPSFRTNIPGDQVNSIALMSNGDILLSGQIGFPGTDPSGQGFRRIAKMNSNGYLTYQYFGFAFQGAGVGSGYTITPWQDKFYVYTGIPYRLLADGNIDTTFHYNSTGTGLNYTAVQAGDYHVFPDGRVLICGNYSLYSGQTYQGPYTLLWLTNTGDIDPARPPLAFNHPITKIKGLPNGQFICTSGGLIQGVITESIIRIHADGAMDTTFHAPQMTFGHVEKFHPLPNGKVLVGGYFRFSGSPDTLSWVRLLPDGRIDTTFNNHMDFSLHYPGDNAQLGVSDFLPFGQDKIIITGGFDQVAGELHGGIAMVDTAGQLLDGYFNGSGCGFYHAPEGYDPLNDQHIVGIIPVPDGSYYIYGSYRGYDDGVINDTLQGFVSRLYGLNTGISQSSSKIFQPLSIAPNPSVGAAVLSVNSPLNHAELSIHDASGRVVWQADWPAGTERYTLPAGALAPGTYVIRVSCSTGSSGSGTIGSVPAGTAFHSGRLMIMP